MSADKFKAIFEPLRKDLLRKNPKPHRILALLSIIQGLEEGIYQENKYLYDSNFKRLFSNWMAQFGSASDKNRPLAPFFHLKALPFWQLSPKAGKERQLIAASSVGSPRELDEIVEYAYFENKVYQLLRDKENCNELKEYLISMLKESGYGGNRVNKAEDSAASSGRRVKNYEQIFFEHEREAISLLQSHLNGIAELIPNVYLFDPSTHQYLECDIIAISSDRLAIIELKHWSGGIQIRPHQWLVNEHYFRKDPHIPNKYKCQVLKSFYESLFPTFPALWVESIVVLTNPDAEVEGECQYKTKKNNPTFADIETLVKHYKYRTGNVELRKLTSSQIQVVAKRLLEKCGKIPAKGFQLPGYEIVENLTQSQDKIELLVRATGHQLQNILRIRVFLDDPNAKGEERKSLRAKSLNSLKAVITVGDHPNIDKVWQIPHEDGLVIEASDWSQEGTLADYLQEKGKLGIDESTKIIQGILQGLSAIHEVLVIHRAVCPQNIRIAKGIPKLINFELSYFDEENRLTVLPEGEKLKPTPYIAPELYEGKDISEATDLFSVGVIFYVMLTGRLPFKNSRELFSKETDLLEGALSCMGEANIPENIQILIYSLIQSHPGKRPQKAQEVLTDIASLLKEAPSEVVAVRSNRELNPGELDRAYEIEELLGRGREAQVYRAKHMVHRKVAIKLFDHEISRERIVSEYDALMRAASPYVVRCEHVDKWSDGRYFLVLRLIEGASIRALIDSHQLPDLTTFKRVTNCLLEALRTMHCQPDDQEPLLHCDIKPENVIITDSNDPVLIDFGTATHPHIGPYMGTPGYVAPDLINGVDLEYCESGDLFALAVTLFEWFFGIKPYDGTPTIDTEPFEPFELRDDVPEALTEWLNRGIQTLRGDRFKSILDMKDAFEAIFREKVPDDEQRRDAIIDLEIDRPVPLPPVPEIPKDNNGFVAYLNTLHNLTAGNENSLAESQALNKYFGKIHVPLDLTRYILAQLTAEGGTNVILTGHAGDGKSTIGLELFKLLKNIPMQDRLTKPLAEKEEVGLREDLSVVIIKDMSELSEDVRLQELSAACADDCHDKRRFIISNTGTLLNSFRRLAERNSINTIALENQLLTLLEQNDPGSLSILGTEFIIINLARMDNVITAEELLDKIINAENWKSCEQCQYTNVCPIVKNICALQHAQSDAKVRISYVYRRIYEYGHRLTMRQIAAHLAYSITSGLNCQDVAFIALQSPKQSSDYLFSDRFFGFSGAAVDEGTTQLAALDNLLLLEMGSRPFPFDLEQGLWGSKKGVLPDVPEALKAEFDDLRKRIRVSATDVPPPRLRQQMRRMLYLFGKFVQEPEGFVAGFLDSPMINEFVSWQSNHLDIKSLKVEALKRKVLHVLQEQYTGIHLPESINPHYLFITLKRSSEELRQSVQILLTKIPLSNFTFEMRQVNTKVKPFRHLLTLVETSSGEILELELPFLDFVILRGMGEVGQKLDVSYVDRLEKFKAKLLGKSNYGNGADLDLLEMSAKGNLVTHTLHFKEDKLQVIS